MIYYFKETPPKVEGDKLIATALNGEAYVEDNNLHIKNATWHLIYKFDGLPTGWYARNVKTNNDVYLGSGACPSIDLEDLDVKDEEYFDSIFKMDKVEITGGGVSQ